MEHVQITKEVFAFLSKLEKNNNRPWFTEHKKEFKKAETIVREFFNALHKRMSGHDEIEQPKLFRIYRDIRFSNDKTPYKTHFAGSFSRVGPERRGGYYLQLKPGESFIATGFWEPNPQDLFRIRKEFETDAARFRKVINHPNLKGIWGSLQGEEVKTAPKGFSREDPNLDLIRKKRFIFVQSFTDKQVMSDEFAEQVNTSFRAIRPYFDLMSEILTTNLNGESVLDS